MNQPKFCLCSFCTTLKMDSPHHLLIFRIVKDKEEFSGKKLFRSLKFNYPLQLFSDYLILFRPTEAHKILTQNIFFIFLEYYDGYEIICSVISPRHFCINAYSFGFYDSETKLIMLRKYSDLN